MKGDVDGVLAGFGSVEKALSDIEDKVQNSTNLTDDLKKRLMQVGGQGRCHMPQSSSWSGWVEILWSPTLRSMTS